MCFCAKYEHSDSHICRIVRKRSTRTFFYSQMFLTSPCLQVNYVKVIKIIVHININNIYVLVYVMFSGTVLICVF